MERADIEETFAPFRAVTIRKMFGGHGIYAGGLCFAIEAFGEIYLKADAQTQGAFEAEGARRFTYDMGGKVKSMAYYTLPEVAQDDEDALKRWCACAFEAARRADLAKQAKARKSAAKRPKKA